MDGVWPLQDEGRRERKVQPRGTARNVLFYEISGAISHIESFDFKENTGTPKDLDVRKLRDDLYLSHLLFPKLEKHMDKFAMMRSMLSHEEVHFRGQYYQQTGRQLNLAFAREIPAIGSVVAMELESKRRRQATRSRRTCRSIWKRARPARCPPDSCRRDSQSWTSIPRPP